MKIIHRLLQDHPENEFTVEMNRAFQGTDVRNWDLVMGTRLLMLPISVIFLAVHLSLLSAWTIATSLGLEGVAKASVFRLSYPTMLVISLVAYGFRKSLVFLRRWRQYVRDQEYLVGRQLHNFREEAEEEGGGLGNGEVSGESEQQPEHPESDQGEVLEALLQFGQEVEAVVEGPVAHDVPLRYGRYSKDEDAGAWTPFDGQFADVPELEPADADEQYGHHSDRSSQQQQPEYHVNSGLGGSGTGSGSSTRASTSHEGGYWSNKHGGEEDTHGYGYGRGHEGVSMDNEDEHEDDGAEDTIAGRTRFRRSQRLQAIRGSRDDRDR